MASLSELIGSTDVLGTRAAANERLEERRRALITNLSKAQPSGRAQAGSAVGAALGQALGAAGAAALGVNNVDPEVARVESNAALARDIQALSRGDNPLEPGTAEHATAAGLAAQAAGRTDLALQFAEQGAALRKSEAVAVTKAEAAQREERRAQFKQFPSAVQEEIIAKSPDIMVRELGITPARAKEISAKVEERNNLQRAKAQKTLNEVKKATGTKVTGTDLAATSSIVDTLTNGEFSESTELESVSRLVAERAQTKADALKDAGEAQDMNSIRAEAFAELVNEGVVLHDPGEVTFGFNLGESLAVDPERLKAPVKREGILKL